ncbi:MAG: alpha-galactosidase [SAR202 cluster bacterium]|nr:alpha-galactosidase [SAR202 cluster bacterium]
MPKIALVGAGSVVFARRFLQDVVGTPSLADFDIALMDVSEDRLDLIGAYARRLVSDMGTSATVDTTTDRLRALEGADYVITTIRVGDNLAIDQGIPLEYGLDQSVADTIGPGGVFKALRTVPALLEICEDMERACPDALLLQYTNPMAMACWAIAEATDIQAVGLCHSVQHTTDQLAEYISAPRESVSAWVAGINHMAWFLRFERDGEDAYPELWDALENDETFALDPVRFEVMRHFGFFVSESTRHMSEYVPYFRTKAERMERFGLSAISTDLSRLETRNDAYFTALRDDVMGPTPLSAEPSDEYASTIMNSIETGEPATINGNVPNFGLISSLAEGACVEVPCLVDELGLHPMAVGELPPHLAALCRSNMAVQELAVRAVLEGSRDAARHAVMLDPLTSATLSLDEIDSMFDEMWAAHGDQLSIYS